jgi:uncharacterized membrane-anchored protein YjiN (DUF445 family)
MLDGALAVLADAMERPEFRTAVSDVIGDLLDRYQDRMGFYPRIWMGLASLLGVLDRERLVAALHAGLREVAKDRDHPLRTRGVEILTDLERRLTEDRALIARVESVKAELLAAPAVAVLLDDAAAALTRTLRAELTGGRSELLPWLVDRLDRARQALIADADLRGELDRWAKARVSELVERHHGRIAAFIANGVRALGPAGAVRLIEEHAGDDLQFIRVNGTLVGGLAGGVIHGVQRVLAVIW